MSSDQGTMFDGLNLSNAPKLPTEWANEIRAGRIPLRQAPDSIRSWFRLYLFNAAKRIVLLDTKEARQRELAKVPDTLRDEVGDEVKRLWPERDALKAG